MNLRRRITRLEQETGALERDRLSAPVSATYMAELVTTAESGTDEALDELLARPTGSFRGALKALSDAALDRVHARMLAVTDARPVYDDRRLGDMSADEQRDYGSATM